MPDIPHADDPQFQMWLRRLDLKMCMDARVLLTKGFDWIDKDLSGELTAPDLHEFAIAMYPADPDPDKTVRGMLYAMSSGTKEERAQATEVTKVDWLNFWDGDYLNELDDDAMHEAQSNMDMTMDIMRQGP